MVSVSINFTLANNIAKEKARKGITMASLWAQRDLKDVLDATPARTGKLRTSGSKARKMTRASAPGEPPAPDTGGLRNRMQIEFEDTGKAIVGSIIVNSEYAAPLHLGTEDMKPRPFMDKPLEGDGIPQAFFKGASK